MSSRRKATPVRLPSRSPASLSLLSTVTSGTAPSDDDLSLLVVPNAASTSTTEEEQPQPSSSRKMIEHDHQTESTLSIKKSKIHNEVVFQKYSKCTFLLLLLVFT